MVTTASTSNGDTGHVRREEGPLARRGTEGPRLYVCATFPDRPRAVIGLLHGFAEYGGRYAHVTRAWAERGIATLALDMRGHGRAEGARGYCDRFQEYLDDASELERVVAERAAGVPAFLYGHSFGGLVGTLRLLDEPRPWVGLLLTGPNFGIALKVPPVKRLAGAITSRVWPGFGLPSGLSGADLTHDANRARAYDNDPLIFKNARARWFTETLAAQERVMARAGSLRLPLHILMGTEDRVSDLSTARTFFQSAGSHDKTFDELPGLFHEVLNEPEWPDLAGRMADWVLARAT
jgi:alpha-beta hydrolase superfamily lysophospholipase